jgi:hypothetical protein
MARKTAETAPAAEVAGKKKQDKYTFQPDPGYRKLLHDAATSGKYGLKVSDADIANEALRRFFVAEGWLKPKK